MRRGALGCALAAALALAGSREALSAGPAPVSYTLSPDLRGGALVGLQVVARFAGDEDGVTEIRLPDRFGGEAGLHQHLADITVEAAQLRRPAPATLRLTHAPGAPLVLRYRLTNGRSPDRDVDYRPDIDPDGFLVLGETVFAWPAGRLSRPASVGMEGFPAGWRLLTDLDRAGTVQDALDSFAVGGPEVRVERRDVGGGRLTLALRGRLAIADDALADTLARVIGAQRESFGDAAQPYSAVVQALPPHPLRRTRDGIARGDAAVFFISPENELDRALRVLAHEPVHAWLPRRVGGLPPGAAEPGAYWFSEGFADYVALRSLLRSGVRTLEDYVIDLDLRLTVGRPMGPPVSNARIAADYGRDPDVFQIPYERGLRLALLWDARLHAETGGRIGLDDVLRAMRAEAAANPSGPTADKLFPRVYRRLSGLDLTADVAAYVEEGRSPPLPDSLYGGCLQVKRDHALRAMPDGTYTRGDPTETLVLKKPLAPLEAERCARSLAGG